MNWSDPATVCDVIYPWLRAYSYCTCSRSRINRYSSGEVFASYNAMIPVISYPSLPSDCINPARYWEYTLLPHGKVNSLEVRSFNLLALRSRDQSVQPVLMTQQHQIRLLPLPFLKDRSDLALLSQDSDALILKVFNKPRMVDLQTFRRFAAPCEPPCAAVALWCFRFLDRACQRREAEGAELEHVGLVQERAYYEEIR
jgi:hypothetical protein